MSRVFSIAVAASLLLASLACNEGGSSRQTRKAQGTTSPGGPCTTNCKPNGTGETATTLASYMLKPEDLKKYSPIVLPYEEPGDSPESLVSFAALSSVRTALESNSNKIMALKDLLPGRTIEVSIIEDESLNAAANGWQQVMVNSGAVKYATEKELLTVICHELAHSARNHTAVTMEFLSTDQKAVEVWSRHERSGNAYLTKVYSISEGTYTHNSALFAQAKADFAAFKEIFEPFRKRQEAEADAVGSMICAKAGLPVADFSGSIISFLSKIDAPLPDGTIGMSELKDGDVVEIPKDLVWDFVFQLDSHPPNAQRALQMKTLSPHLTPFEVASSPVATTWLKELVSARAASNVVALTSFMPPKTLNLKTQEGVAIKLPRKSCIEIPRHID